jgi:predicted acetyltransferase
VAAAYGLGMTVETAPIPQERAGDYVRAVSLGFHDVTATDQDTERQAERWVEGRWWAATDNNTIVATVRTDHQLTALPGGHLLPTSGLTGVTTHATHRRRGLLRDMLIKSLRADKEAGEPLSTLIAAEWAIYGRFGYGAATEHAAYTLKTSARWLYEGAGRVELVDNATMVAEAPAIYEQHHVAHASEIDRNAIDWRNKISGRPSKPWTGFQAICRNDQGVGTGYVRYTIDGTFDARQPTGTLTLEELIAVDTETEARLWRYLCEIDWIQTIKAGDRSVSERVQWWIEDGRDFRLTERSDFIWARPLDVAQCLSMRTYATPIDVVIEVLDPLGLCAGRYRLQSDKGEGAATPTTDSPHLTLPVSTIGSVLFGGHTLELLASVGQCDEHKVGAIQSTSTALRTPTPPWSTTWF